MYSINIILNSRDGATRIAVQALDGELDKMNALHGPGVVFAQVFPQMLENGRVLGVNLRTVVLDHEAGLKIKAILRESESRAITRIAPTGEGRSQGSPLRVKQ